MARNIVSACLSRVALVPLLGGMALLVACSAPYSPTPPATQARAPSIVDAPVTVQFANASAFTEIRNHPQQSDSYNKGWMEALSKHLEQRAPRYLEPGMHLYIRFTDVRLAGDYEPWRRPGFSDVRIVRDIYPPRLDLSYRLSDSSGQVVRQGSSILRDSAFLMRADRYPEDPQRYEKNLLDDWLRETFEGR